MAVQKVGVNQNLLDEAIRIGNESVIRANSSMRVTRELLTAIEQTIALLDTGRTTKARERLVKALQLCLKIAS